MAADSAHPLAHCAVLLAEDQDFVRQTMERFLAQAGAQVTAVENGADALAIEAVDGFEVILCDVRMDPIDGIDLVAELRRKGFTGGVILFSSDPAEDFADDAEDLSVDQVLTKPIKRDELIEAVQRFR